MRTSARWINAYLNPHVSSEEQARAFTAIGFPCESSTALPSGDVQQEVETTSNRGDCLCHLGLAREVAAATGGTFVPPPVKARRAASAISGLTIDNQDPGRCPRYTARVIRGVKVGPSPEWLRERLLSIGQIPRNNIVDCSNFVLFECGQPTHTFDLATLKGGAVEIRPARPGERFLPIGEGAKEIALAGGELVIADRERPIALAGVKGGALTAVTAGTTELLIEAAAFDPIAVRSTSRRHGIASDSSYRFERGVAPGDVDAAAERLVELILATAGGTACDGSVEAGIPLAPARSVSLRLAKLHAVVGVRIRPEEVMRILEALGFDPQKSHGVITCTIPARRLDVTREIDLIEEVIRIAGCDQLEVAETVAIRPIGNQVRVAAVRKGRDALAAAGFVETVTHTLISERAAALFVAPGRTCLRTDDERSLGEPILRPSLLPSLLATLSLNTDRGVASRRFFEHAATFWLEGAAHRERRTISLVVGDQKDAEGALRAARGAAELLARVLCGAGAKLHVAAESDGPCANARTALDPGGKITVDGREIGAIGLVSSDVLKSLGIEGPIGACECDWDLLSAGYPPTPLARPLATRPLLDRDISIVVDDSVSWSALKAAVGETALPHLEAIEFVGVWRGKSITKGRKSVTLRVVFRADDRTLRREEIEPEIARLTSHLTSTFAAELRA